MSKQKVGSAILNVQKFIMSLHILTFSHAIIASKTWEPPHENEKISKEQKERIIQKVQKSMNENTVQIIFE